MKKIITLLLMLTLFLTTGCAGGKQTADQGAKKLKTGCHSLVQWLQG